MPRAIDMTGQKFGRLTVVSKAESKKKKSGTEARWNVVCECGTSKVVDGWSMRSGNTRSCGCLHRESASRLRRIDDRELAAVRLSFSQYKGSSKKRGRKFDLTEGEFRSIVTADCFYCGAKPGEGRNHAGSSSRMDVPLNGIDRVDNDSDYTVESTRPCCPRCNVAKSVHSESDFIAMCHAVASRHPLQGTVNLQVADVLRGPWASRNESASPLRWAVQ